MATVGRSVIGRRRERAAKRDLKKVPFVELAPGRLQGVVSSGSDATRVYVSFVDVGTTDFYCSTNNNRPCGGLRGAPCKHIGAMIANAVAAYGAARVARHLQLDAEATDARAVEAAIHGSARKQPASEVFSRFLAYLRYVELAGTAEPIPELGWFYTG